MRTGELSCVCVCIAGVCVCVCIAGVELFQSTYLFVDIAVEEVGLVYYTKVEVHYCWSVCRIANIKSS